MIARILGAGITIVVYFCAATLMAQAILGGYLWMAWKMDPDRAIQMLAIAQGIDLFAAARAHAEDEDDPGPEQPSLEQLIAARTAKDLDLALREQALQGSGNQVASLERQLAEKQGEFKRTRGVYETQLQELTDARKLAGREENRLMLESIKPAHAKKQLDLMLENGELDEVVLLLVDMEPRKRTGVLKEFEDAPEDNEKLDEILKRIRDGGPAAALAQQTADELAANGQNAPGGGKP